MESIDRNAMVLYLRDLRDLEIAKRNIWKMSSEKDVMYKGKISELSVMNRMGMPEEYTGLLDKILYGTVFGITGIATALLLYFLIRSEFTLLLVVGFPIYLTGRATWWGWKNFYKALKDSKHNKAARREAALHNAVELARVQDNAEVCQRLEKERREWIEYFESEYKKVGRLLQSNYNLNILPNQYRNLQSLYYIYDYMSSSQASLEETLMHEHMENGIQRILEKLDGLIDSNQQIIFQNRILKAKNQEMIDQNEKILTHLQNAESNTALAAQYAGVAAGYNAANAYFSAANYLVNTSK